MFANTVPAELGDRLQLFATALSCHFTPVDEPVSPIPGRSVIAPEICEQVTTDPGGNDGGAAFDVADDAMPTTSAAANPKVVRRRTKTVPITRFPPPSGGTSWCSARDHNGARERTLGCSNAFSRTGCP
jgi:hypothetical protein